MNPLAGGPEEGLVSRWTTVDGWSMHALVPADPSRHAGPPVVLVHGLGVSGRYMVPTAVRLARHLPTYVPDLPGFGKSARPPHALGIPFRGLARILGIPASPAVEEEMCGTFGDEAAPLRRCA